MTITAMSVGLAAAASLVTSPQQRGCGSGVVAPINSSSQIRLESDLPLDCLFTLAYASATASAQNVPYWSPPDCGCTEGDVGADVGVTQAAAEAEACFFSPDPSGGYGFGFASIECGSSHIEIRCAVQGGAITGLACLPCNSGAYSAQGGGGAGARVQVQLHAEAMLDIEAYISGDASAQRAVSVSFACVDSNVSAFYAMTSMGGVSTPQSSGAAVVESGIVTLQAISLSISDTLDDVTGDSRFNQHDVDFLGALVGTSAAHDPPYQRFNFIDDQNSTADDGVDAGDVELLQMFINSGLSSGFLGDGNHDGVIDCSDIIVAASQPFAGEAFPSASYRVELDANLDGVNDSADREAVRDVLLSAEPANFSLDDTIDFFDTAAYMALFNAQDPRADLVAPFGQINFFDFQAFTIHASNPNCL